MPNWCVNDLTVTAPKQIIKDIMDSELSLQKLLPCPQELLETSSPAKFNDKEKAKLNIAKYGFADWYDWQVNNWGTKWDIGPISMEHVQPVDNFDGTSTISIGFDSAWSPPVEAVKKIYEKYKDNNIEIRLEYFEPGCSFLGVAKTIGGDFFDECYEYCNADELQSWVDELEHNLASSEVDYLREREAEDAEEAVKKEIEVKNIKNKKTNSSSKNNKKTSNKNTKKISKKKAPAKKAKKKTAVKKSSKKIVKKSSQKKIKKN